MVLSLCTKKEVEKMVVDFNEWLMANDPAPKSVAEIRLYWQTKRKELAYKIMAHYDKKLKDIMRGR